MSELKVVEGGLPASIQSMATGLAASVGAVGGAGGSELYMKFTKFGEWKYGAEGTEVQDGSIWAVNPAQFQHGWVAWGTEAHGTDGTNVGEVMVNAAIAMPPQDDLPEVKGDWNKAIAVMLRCTNGEDEGTQVLFKSNSIGGRKAYATLLQQVVEKLTAKDPEVVPLVELEADSYTHNAYGKIFIPVLKTVGWTTLDGESTHSPETPPEEPAAKTPDEPAQEEKPTRRRRRKAS